MTLDIVILSLLGIHANVVAVCIFSQHDFGLNDMQLVTLCSRNVAAEPHQGSMPWIKPCCTVLPLLLTSESTLCEQHARLIDSRHLTYKVVRATLQYICSICSGLHELHTEHLI